MNQICEISKIATQARILGVLLYRSPENDDVRSLVNYMKTGAWMAEWGGDSGSLLKINEILNQCCQETDEDVFQRLFIGPYALPAPPWGSVYMDEENVIFGESTVELRRWMHENHISGMTNGKEPEDHFGLLMLMTAWIAEEKSELLNELLSNHMLPWGYRFLSLLRESSQQTFYEGISVLAYSTLQSWQNSLNIEVKEVNLYR